MSETSETDESVSETTTAGTPRVSITKQVFFPQYRKVKALLVTSLHIRSLEWTHFREEGVFAFSNHVSSSHLAKLKMWLCPLQFCVVVENGEEGHMIPSMSCPRRAACPSCSSETGTWIWHQHWCQSLLTIQTLLLLPVNTVLSCFCWLWSLLLTVWQMGVSPCFVSCWGLAVESCLRGSSYQNAVNVKLAQKASFDLLSLARYYYNNNNKTKNACTMLIPCNCFCQVIFPCLKRREHCQNTTEDTSAPWCQPSPWKPPNPRSITQTCRQKHINLCHSPRHHSLRLPARNPSLLSSPDTLTRLYSSTFAYCNIWLVWTANEVVAVLVFK